MEALSSLWCILVPRGCSAPSAVVQDSCKPLFWFHSLTFVVQNPFFGVFGLVGSRVPACPPARGCSGREMLLVLKGAAEMCPAVSANIEL